MNFASKCTSQSPLDSWLECLSDAISLPNFQAVPAPAGFAAMAKPRWPALEVNSTRSRLNEPLKLKRLTRRVVIKPDGRYLIYYEQT